MTAKRILLAIVLLNFSALTAGAVWEHGYLGFFDLVFANSATITVGVDLVIALSLVLLWMWQDARSRGVSPLPYAALTLAFGSVGPLLYLVIRPEAPAAVVPSSLAVSPR